jgi:hypothetical protein
VKNNATKVYGLISNAAYLISATAQQILAQAAFGLQIAACARLLLDSSPSRNASDKAAVQSMLQLLRQLYHWLVPEMDLSWRLRARLLLAMGWRLLLLLP